MIPNCTSVFCTHRKSSKDRVSAHRIALLAIIREFCMVKNKFRSANRFLQGNSEDVWEQTNQQQRDFVILVLKLIQSPDTDLKELKASAKGVLHPKTYAQFLERLQELRNNSVEGIMDFMQSLEMLLVDPQNNPPVVHKSSVLGLFIRRMILAFDKLSFSNVAKLHHKINDYYDSSLETVDSNEASMEECDVPVDTKDDAFEDSRILASQKQAEFFISQQASLLQINEKEALSPAELQQKIHELLRGNPDFAEAHYVSYLNCLRVNEYIGANENLYHYFDRSISVSQEPKPTIGSEDTNRSFRYAALNLAILQTKFGHRKEALSALKEAITMAQDANDNICLQHALSWLYHLTPNNQEMLTERSISKSGDLNLWYLSSIGILALTKLKALSGMEPSHVFDIMMKSDILNCQHSITEVMGSAYSQRAAIWSLYGNSCMEMLCSQLLLFLNTSDPVHGGVYHIGEGTCLALCNLAWKFSLLGKHESAFQILAQAKNLFPPQSEHCSIWMLCETLVCFERALHHGKWQEAEKMINAALLLDPMEGKLRNAQLKIQTGNYLSAQQITKELLEECKKKDGPPAQFHVRVLLLTAQLHIQSENASRAVPALTQCLSLCNEHNLVYLSAFTELHLAGVQLLMNLPSPALNLLSAMYVSILQHGSSYDIGCLQLLYAKCLVSLSKSSANRTQALYSAVKLAKKSEMNFRTIESYQRVKDCLHWQALFYNELGDTQNRNKCALNFRHFDQQMKSYNQNTIHIP